MHMVEQDFLAQKRLILPEEVSGHLRFIEILVWGQGVQM